MVETAIWGLRLTDYELFWLSAVAALIGVLTLFFGMPYIERAVLTILRLFR